MKTVFDLNSSIEDIKAGKIDGVVYGDPKKPMGYLSQFKISYISTVSGYQYAIHPIFMERLGSGMYFGNNVSAVIEHAEKMIAQYNKPHSNPLVHEFLKKRNLPELKYYTV